MEQIKEQAEINIYYPSPSEVHSQHLSGFAFRLAQTSFSKGPRLEGYTFFVYRKPQAKCWDWCYNRQVWFMWGEGGQKLLCRRQVTGRECSRQNIFKNTISAHTPNFMNSFPYTILPTFHVDAIMDTCGIWKLYIYGSVQEKVSSFSKNKTKNFDDYMDYY